MHTFRNSKIKLTLFILMIGVSLFTHAQNNNTRPTVPVLNNFEVNSYTGNLFHSRTDFRIPGKGLQIDVTFSYNISRRKMNWGMGKGWTCSYNMAYANDSLGIWIERMDGRRDLFRHIGSAYIAPSGIFDTLVEYQTGKYYLKAKDNTKFFFENSTHKRLTKIQDLNSNQITLSYTDSVINSLTDNAGHILNFTWTNGKLTEINDISCSPTRKVIYEYDTSGNPMKVINPLNDFVLYYYDSTSKIIGFADENDRRMSFVYNSNTAVAKIVSCITTHAFSYLQEQQKTYVTETVNGDRVVTTYQFDSTGKVITKKGNCCGFNTTYEYDTKTNVKKRIDGKNNFVQLEYDSHGNITNETDMLGNTNVYTYNLATNKLTSSKDKNGNTYTYLYDANSNLIEIQKPLGITEQYTYDASGNKLSFTDVNNKTTNFEYNASGYLIKITDAEGGITEMTYDCHGNKITEKDANNHTTTFEYNVLNQLTKITNAIGNNSILTYDKVGNLKTLKNPLNKTTSYDFDGIDRLTKVTSPLGISKQIVYDEQGNIVKQIDGRGKVTLYTYNSRKQVVSETDALGNTISYEYDDAGNKTSMKDKRNGVTQYEYNDIYQLTKVTNAIGGTKIYSYDANGNRVSEIDANGNITSYQYDALNRLVKVTDPFNKNVQYTYDGNGNRLSAKDKRGNITTYTFDNLNREKNITDALGGVIVNTYDANGNILSQKDQLNHTTTYTYDALNKQVSSTNALNETTSYTYDAAGNRYTTTIPNGNVIINHYDDDNRLTSVTDALGSIVEFTLDNSGNILIEKDGNNNTTIYEYDGLNRKTKITDALTKSMLYVFDADGNVISATDRNSHIKSYTYDLLNRKLTEIDAIGGVTTFSYDANGNELIVKDAKNNTTAYNYDVLNRVTKEIYADGSSMSLTYDENGNTKTRKDNNGATTTYAYDVLNRLTSRTYPDANSEVFTYDAIGKMLTANNVNATITYSYDNANRVVSENLNGKTTAFAYNVTNSTRALTYPGGRTITEEYDDRDRLNYVKEGATNLASFGFDAGSRITQKTYLNGDVTSYAYNYNDWVTTLTTQPNNAVNFAYTFDDEGNMTSSLKNHNTTHSEKYTYDAINRIVNFNEGTLSAGNITTPITQTQFNYDGVGNRTTVLKDAGTTTYTSNNTNEYTSIITSTNVSPTYDANGNTLSDGLHTYTYDYENRLTQVDGGTTATYKYDAFGRRIQKVISTATINYYYAENSILEERDAVDNILATYVYSDVIDDILSMRRNGNDYFYLKNSLGSIVAITNSLGSVIERYEYDAYGNPTIHNNSNVLLSTSAIGNTYMFTGREYNTESGNYYYRARYYSSLTGRFLQRDPIGYLDGLNLYEYVSSNPINFSDPFGLFAIQRDPLGMFEWQTFGVTLLEDAAATAAIYGAGVVFTIAAPTAAAAVTVAAGAFIATTAGTVILVGAAAYGGFKLGQQIYQWGWGKEWTWDGSGRQLCDNEIAESAGHSVFGLATLATSAYNAFNVPKANIPIDISDKKVIIGETMARVEAEATKHPSSIILNDMPKFEGTRDQITNQMMAYNRKWFLEQMKSGRSIIDIGLDPSRNTRSIFYESEQSMIRNYLKLHPRSLNIIKL